MQLPNSIYRSLIKETASWIQTKIRNVNAIKYSSDRKLRGCSLSIALQADSKCSSSRYRRVRKRITFKKYYYRNRVYQIYDDRYTQRPRKNVFTYLRKLFYLIDYYLSIKGRYCLLDLIGLYISTYFNICVFPNTLIPPISTSENFLPYSYKIILSRLLIPNITIYLSLLYYYGKFLVIYSLENRLAKISYRLLSLVIQSLV